jgi:hypothetical protein
MTHRSPALLSIRPARPDEAEALTALFYRSKAHWGYDDDFMAWVRSASGCFLPQMIDHIPADAS